MKIHLTKNIFNNFEIFNYHAYIMLATIPTNNVVSCLQISVYYCGISVPLETGLLFELPPQLRK